MWDQQAEAMSTDERAALQTQRLGAVVTRLMATSAYYQQRPAEAGLEAGATITLDDLSKLPFTTKPDHWEHYLWGMLTIPREEVVRVHASSGTGGRPTLSAYSRADLALWAEMCARALDCAHARSSEVIQISCG